MPTPASRPATVLCFYCCSILGLLLPASLVFPLCTDQRAPLPLNGTLPFCGNAGTSSCCDAAAGAALRKQLNSAKVSDAPCAAVLKSLLCAKCNPYSAELFDAGPNIRTVPFLCNSTPSRPAGRTPPPPHLPSCPPRCLHAHHLLRHHTEPLMPSTSTASCCWRFSVEQLLRHPWIVNCGGNAVAD